MCEDYRAAASIDLEHDRASRAAGAKVQCPLLVLWGAKGKIGQWYDAARDLAAVLRGRGDRRRHRQRPLPGRGGAAGGGRASSSRSSRDLGPRQWRSASRSSARPAKLDTGTVAPRTPSWAALWGFAGCIRWLEEAPAAGVDALSPLCLPEAPSVGAEHWLSVGKPFHAALERGDLVPLSAAAVLLQRLGRSSRTNSRSRRWHAARCWLCAMSAPAARSCTCVSPT